MPDDAFRPPPATTPKKILFRVTAILGNDGTTEDVLYTFPDNGQPTRFLRLLITAP